MKRITNLIPHYLILVFYYIFPFLVSTTSVLLVLELFTYTGFISKNLGVSTQFLVLITVFSGVGQFVISPQKRVGLIESLSKIIGYFNMLILPPLLLVNAIVLRIESQKYENYLFSNYHINIGSIKYLVFFVIYVFIVNIIKIVTILHNETALDSSITKNKSNITLNNLQHLGLPLISYMRSLFPVFVLMVLMIYGFETFKYPGFFRKYFMLEPSIFIVFSYWSTLLSFDTQKQKKLTVFINCIKIFSIVTVSSYLILVYLEGTKYRNYVFEKLHIHLELLGVIAIYFLTLWVILKVKRKINFLKSALPDSNYVSVRVTALAFIFTYVLLNFTSTFNSGVINNLESLSHINYSYDDKMKYTWRTFYIYMKFVKDNTHENAVIAIPPAEDHWLHEGNSLLDIYFLYPRTLISGTVYDLPKVETEYILLAKGLWNRGDSSFGWPKVYLPNTEIKYLDIGSEKYTTVYGPFDPDDSKNKDAWGLIKVLK